MMSHPRGRDWTRLLYCVGTVMTLALLLVVLTGCKGERTRPPGRDDVVRPTAHATTHPCRCGTRPPAVRR